MIYSYTWPVHIDTEGGFPIVSPIEKMLVLEWEKEHPGVPWSLTLTISKRETEPADAARA